MAHRRKKVKWTDGTTGANRRRFPFFPYGAPRRPDTNPDDVPDGGAAPPGALFIATKHLMQLPDNPDHEPPPMPYLVPSPYPNRAIVAPGEILVYLGELRVEEGPAWDSMRRVLRHRFLVSGRAFIVADLRTLRRAEGP